MKLTQKDFIGFKNLLRFYKSIRVGYTPLEKAEKDKNN